MVTMMIKTTTTKPDLMMIITEISLYPSTSSLPGRLFGVQLTGMVPVLACSPVLLPLLVVVLYPAEPPLIFAARTTVCYLDTTTRAWDPHRTGTKFNLAVFCEQEERNILAVFFGVA